MTKAFPSEDCVPVIKDLELGVETALMQRSLGLLWDIRSDIFTYSASTIIKPFTRRGVLSTVNSVFDPLGLVAPVTIQGRALLRELSSQLSDWDTPFTEDKRKNWETWRDSLQDLKQLQVSRMYTPTSLTKAVYTELCIFSDASTKAIGVVAYLRAVQEGGKVEVGLVMGKAKLAPQSALTIPRLELCAAVLAVEVADVIQEELDLKLDAIRFFTDSKVVLGYIYNETKRFYTYVHNRVQPPNQNNGVTFVQKKIQRTMHRDLCLQPALHRVLGSLDLPSCMNYLQTQCKLMKSFNFLYRSTTPRSGHRCIPALLTWRKTCSPLTAFSAFPHLFP